MQEKLMSEGLKSENLLLRRIAELAGEEIIVKCESILHGTCTIGELPIDITIHATHVTLNGVGVWAGDAKKMSKGIFRGKGKFRALIPSIKQALIEFGFEAELYLTPISPVWNDNYNLVWDGTYGYKIVL
jgi:hypothetical protein